jgi:hypothetical protein
MKSSEKKLKRAVSPHPPPSSPIKFGVRWVSVVEAFVRTGGARDSRLVLGDVNARFLRSVICFLLTTVCLLSAVSPSSADTLTLSVNGTEVELIGEILITAQDESLYFRENDGRIWFVKPEQIKQKTDDDADVPPISAKSLGAKLLAELPNGFRIYQTKHYVIAYQNELAYARWIGGLYESRLYRGFETYWKKRKKFPLTDPQFPLVAVIFGSETAYNDHVTRELGAGQSMVAYYNLESNRVTMYDLTASISNPTQELSERKIGEILAAPSAVPMVATIIHEGTHQLMFNRGMQTRFAESPLWLNEGLAIFFETPDRRASRGWRVPGLVSDIRLMEFLRNLPNRPENALPAMIGSDDSFRDPEAALARYAEAWAFNHFLLNERADVYLQYLRHMSTKKALAEETAEIRIGDFQKFFGEDWGQLEADFIEYVRGLR